MAELAEIHLISGWRVAQPFTRLSPSICRIVGVDAFLAATVYDKGTLSLQVRGFSGQVC